MIEPQELQDWLLFCEDEHTVDPNHFATMFMELYLAPLTEKDKQDLALIFSHVSNSEHILEKMIRMDARAEDKTESDIIDLVNSDLKEMRQFINSQPVLDAIDRGIAEEVKNETHFEVAVDSDLNHQFIHILSDFFVGQLANSDGKIRALSNAFYGLASNLHLQWVLTADLLNTDLNFNHYFELYLIGVDYAITRNGAVVMNYRKITND